MKGRDFKRFHPIGRESIRGRFVPGVRRSIGKPFFKKRRNSHLVPPKPLIKLIGPADLVTLLNFICGVLAVMASVNGGDSLRLAMILILMGVVFDGLDGPVARRFGSSHNFGIWLDSLADAVTFCIAPAILVYNMFKVPPSPGDVIPLLMNIHVVSTSLSIAVLGILRLARFSLSMHRWKDFIGLPTPAMAMLVVALSSLRMWSVRLGWDIEGLTSEYSYIVPAALLVISWAMVSDVLFRKYRGRIMVISGFFILIEMFSLLLGVQEPVIGMMGSIMFSAAGIIYLFSPISKGPRNIWGARKRLMEEYPGEEDELEELFEDEVETY